MSMPLSGLVPVLATPFDIDGSLDLASLRRLVEFQLTSRVDGLGLFGIASEGFALTRTERALILSEVTDIVRGATPLVLGVSASSTVGALEQAREYETAAGATLMVMPPVSASVSPHQVLEFFTAVAAVAVEQGQSVMIQDAPLASGVALTPSTILDLAAIPGITSIKVEAPPTVSKMEQVVSVQAAWTPAPLAVLGGQNAQFVLDEYAVGATGTMPACEFVDLLRPILDTWEAGREADARAAFAVLLPLIVHGLQAGFAWSVHKEVLVARGLIAHGTVRLPAKPLTAGLATNLSAVVRTMPEVEWAQ